MKTMLRLKVILSSISWVCLCWFAAQIARLSTTALVGITKSYVSVSRQSSPFYHGKFSSGDRFMFHIFNPMSHWGVLKTHSNVFSIHMYSLVVKGIHKERIREFRHVKVRCFKHPLLFIALLLFPAISHLKTLLYVYMAQHMKSTEYRTIWCEKLSVESISFRLSSWEAHR